MTLPVDKLFGAANDHDDFFGKDEVFEDKTIKFMLKHLNLVAEGRELSRLNREMGFGNYLKHRAFREKYSLFPFRLESSSLAQVRAAGSNSRRRRTYNVGECKHFKESARYKNFRKSPVVSVYDDLLEGIPNAEAEIPFGLVFKATDFATGGLIIHTDTDETFWRQGSAWVFKGNQENQTKYYIQPFKDVLEAIVAAGWTP